MLLLLQAGTHEAAQGAAGRRPRLRVAQGAAAGGVLFQGAAAGQDSELRRVLLQGAAGTQSSARCCCKVLQLLQPETHKAAQGAAGCRELRRVLLQGRVLPLLQGNSTGRDSEMRRVLLQGVATRRESQLRSCCWAGVYPQSSRSAFFQLSLCAGEAI